MKKGIAFIIGFGIIYLMVSFGCVDLNIKNWTWEARFFCASFGFIAGIVSVFIETKDRF